MAKVFQSHLLLLTIPSIRDMCESSRYLVRHLPHNPFFELPKLLSFKVKPRQHFALAGFLSKNTPCLVLAKAGPMAMLKNFPMLPLSSPLLHSFILHSPRLVILSVDIISVPPSLPAPKEKKNNKYNYL